MKKQLIFMFMALSTILGGCHEPEELIPTSVGIGLSSVSAQFATGDNKVDPNAKFTTSYDGESEKVVIDVAYYYPENSTNLTEITNMRVTAVLEDNCYITPSLGVLDLTKEHWFTLVKGDKSEKKICITGNIKKSDKCAILSFISNDPTISGIIDEENKTISLISIEDLSAKTAAVVMSPHASISPDPAVANNYNDGVEFTVTAHDGTTKAVYTVSKDIPRKIPFGIRPGSMKLLWEKKLFGDLGISTINMTGGMAVVGNRILLNTRNENSIIVDALTGDKVGTYELPKKGSLVNFYNTADDAGNVLLCNLSPNAGAFQIHKIAHDLQTSPSLFIEWKGGKAMGRKISVVGSVDGDAIITAPIHVNGTSFARWQVVGGVLKSQTPDLVTLTGASLWSNTNADVIYTDPTDVTSPIMATYYGSGNNIVWFNGATNAKVSQMSDPSGSNFILNNIDFVEFNNSKYIAFTSINSFSWGGGGNPISTDCCWMVDANSSDAFTGHPSDKDNPIHIMQSLEYSSRAVSNGGAANGNATGDIAFYASADGYKLYMYMMITNGWIVAWEFDCIDK